MTTQNMKQIQNKPPSRKTYEIAAREGEIIYAGDTNIIAEQDAPKQLIARLNNYQNVTNSRQTNIQWGKVEIIEREKRTHAEK